MRLKTTTTGSATVRILRPPSEAAVRREARENADAHQRVDNPTRGCRFSEGTNHQEIEDSPADFDLSPPKLDNCANAESRPHYSAMTACQDELGCEQAVPPEAGTTI